MEPTAPRLIKVDDVLVARDGVPGSIFYGIETMVTEPTHANHPEQLMRSILRGLCVSDKLADGVAYLRLQGIESINGPIFSRLKQSAPKVGAGKKVGVVRALVGRGVKAG